MAYGFQQTQHYFSAVVATDAAPSVALRFPKGALWSAAVTYGTANGFAYYEPGLQPQTVDMIGIRLTANQTDPVNIYVEKQFAGGAPAATDLCMTFPVPTNAATGAVIYRRPTKAITVKPGEYLVLTVSTAVNAMRGCAMIMVHPTPEEPGNCTGMIAASS